MIITKEMYDVLNQPYRTLHAKIELLNFQFLTIDEIQGVVTDGSLRVDANSDIRNTCDIEMVVKGNSYKIEPGGKIWLNSYIRVWVGVETNKPIYETTEQGRTLAYGVGDIVWFNKGIYLINQPTLSYNAETHMLKFEGVSLMAKLTGLRNGQLEGTPVKIDSGSTISGVIGATLEEQGFKDYIITTKENEETLPNDIEFDIGPTSYDIISQVRDVYINYQTYFDENGVFHYEPIPSGDNEVISATHEVFDKLAMGYDVSTNFEDVKNYIEVYGKTHDTEFYADCTIENGMYKATIEDVFSINELEDVLVGITVPRQLSGSVYIKINTFDAVQIVAKDGEIDLSDDEAYYIIAYDGEDDVFYYYGHLQAQGFAKDDNPASPFYVGENNENAIRLVLTGGDYDVINSDELAAQRARFELYQRCRLNDTLTIQCVPIYYLDVYNLIEVKLPDEDIAKQYIIQSINTNLGEGEIQTIVASRYYPYIP